MYLLCWVCSTVVGSMVPARPRLLGEQKGRGRTPAIAWRCSAAWGSSAQLQRARSTSGRGNGRLPV